jgi:hypothetical protein
MPAWVEATTITIILFGCAIAVGLAPRWRKP